jgi:hypothetical protein
MHPSINGWQSSFNAYGSERRWPVMKFNCLYGNGWSVRMEWIGQSVMMLVCFSNN